MEILTNVQLFLLCPDGDVVSFTGAEKTITMELESTETVTYTHMTLPTNFRV